VEWLWACDSRLLWELVPTSARVVLKQNITNGMTAGEPSAGLIHCSSKKD
jgi:hypothetical protein